MRIVFMGTSEFAVPLLEELSAAEYELPVVVTQPDRPLGRGLKIEAPPIKKAAETHGLPLLQPERIGNEERCTYLKGLSPDLFVVAAYGQILPTRVLDIPRLGSINIHASLLPKYRGAEPIRRALMCGEKQTGVTTMWMSERMDEGDIIFQQALDIGAEENFGQLHDRLARASVPLLMKTLEAVAAGKAPHLPQEAVEASYAPPLGAEEKRIDWKRPAEAIFNQIRALNPTPGAYAVWKSKRLKVWRSEKSASVEGIPGKIVEIDSFGLTIACGQGGLRLLELQPEGRKRQFGDEFVRGYRPEVGDVLE